MACQTAFEALQILEETNGFKKHECQAMRSATVIDMTTLPNETKKLSDLIAYYRDIRMKLEIVRKAHFERLGLKIERKGENLKFGFDHIARDRKSEHSITITLRDNKYKIVDCIPDIPKLNELLLELNSTLILGNFLKKLRKEFTKLYI